MQPTNQPSAGLPRASCHRAALLWWLWILPQALLCLLNLRNFLLVCGEMTLPQITRAGYVGAANLGLLASGCVILLALRLRDRPIPLRLCWPILLAHIAYLWWFTAGLADMLPRSVAAWILPQARVLYQQFALIMPALFYALVRVASYPVPWSRGRDVALSVGVVTAVLLPCVGLFGHAGVGEAYLFFALCVLAATAVPAPLFLAARAALRGPRRSALTIGTFAVWSAMTLAAFIQFERDWRWSYAGDWIGAACMIVLAATFMLHILRLLVRLEVWLAERGPVGGTVLAALVGLAGPLGGLFLNHQIPFPADFQCLSVYSLAIANGALLLFPSSRSGRRALAAWWLQAALFPFTFYFFIVFLPFLPFSVFAIVGAGAGFLVLVPTALFLYHGRRVLEGLRLAQLAWGPRAARLALAAALSALPLVLAASAFVDRAGLRQAMAYVFEPAYEQDAFSGSRALVRRTLARMVDARAARRLPILSGAYNRIVFGGLVLPDDKLKQMQDVFFGGPLPARTKPSLLAEVFGQPRDSIADEISGDPDRLRAFTGPAAMLTDLTQRVAPEAGSVRTLLCLSLANTNSTQAEFVTRLHLPDGVLVSGLWLYMDQERVAGQLFEKKTAMWVYRMITGARRDPALLVYTAPETAELRVFPVESHQERVMEIELLHAAGQAQTVQVGERTVTLPALGAPQNLALARGSNETATLLLDGAEFPTLTREPYLHFIVDQSAAAEAAAPPAERVRAAWARFPHIRDGVVTLANYEFAEPAELAPRPLEEVTAALQDAAASALPCRGGFCRDRAIQRALLLRAARLDDPSTADAERRRAPVFVVLQASNTDAATDTGSLAWFLDLAPDFPQFYLIRPGGAELHPFDGAPRPVTEFHPALEPVALIRCGGQFAPVARATTLLHLDRLATEAEPSLDVYDPTTQRFVPGPPLAPLAASAFRNGLEVWAQFMRLQHVPAQTPTLWPEVVRASKACGIQVPVTAWIAVENSAQRKMLERKEDQKLHNAEALAFQSVPEPGTASLMVLGALVLVARRWRQRRCVA